MKNIKFMGLLAILFAVFSCQKQSELIDQLDFDREFSPQGLEVPTVNYNSATVKWKAMKGSTEHFAIQLFAGDSLKFEGMPVLEQNVEYQYEVKLENLLPEVQYSVRIKTVGASDAESSKWHGIAFKTTSYQGLVAVKNIKATKATINWKSGETATHLLFTASGETDIIINLDAADLAAATKAVTGLRVDKTYTVYLYDGIGRKGKLSFKTMYKPEGATEVPAGADLLGYLVDGSVLLLPDGYTWTGPTNAMVNLPSNIAIYGDPDADAMPLITGTFSGGGKCFFNLPETGGNILIANVEITQLNGLGGFSIFDQQSACTIASLKLNNCYIHDIERSLVRLRDKACIITSLVLDGCLVDNVGYSASNNQTFYFQAAGGYVTEFKLKNSTFNSCGWKTQFIDNRPDKDQNSSVIIENCTFYDVIAGDNNTSVRYFLIATVSGSSVVSLKTTNSIFGKTFDAATANLQGVANTAVTIDATSAGNFKTNDWLTGTSLNNGATTTLDFAGITTTGGSAADLFVNPAAKDFTLKSNVSAAIKSAGDPRWW